MEQEDRTIVNAHDALVEFAREMASMSRQILDGQPITAINWWNINSDANAALNLANENNESAE